MNFFLVKLRVVASDSLRILSVVDLFYAETGLMNPQESYVPCVLCEARSAGAFKQCTDVAEEADGSVAGGMFWIFACFMDHRDTEEGEQVAVRSWCLLDLDMSKLFSPGAYIFFSGEL